MTHDDVYGDMHPMDKLIIEEDLYAFAREITRRIMEPSVPETTVCGTGEEDDGKRTESTGQ